MTPPDTGPLGLTMERTIRAPRARVWEAWTRAEELARWFAPVGVEIPGVEVDLRVGGEWKVTMRDAESGRVYVGFGTYREISPPERLVFTHAWFPQREDDPPPLATTVTVDLAEVDGGTRVALRHEGFAAAPAVDGHREGWVSCLDRLEALEGIAH